MNPLATVGKEVKEHQVVILPLVVVVELHMLKIHLMKLYLLLVQVAELAEQVLWTKELMAVLEEV